MHRCEWPDKNDDLMIEYHDIEWGTPQHDDKVLFEYLLLDSFQAGLSWRTILHKRKNFAKAFDNFDYKKIAKYDENKKKQLLENPGIIRNKLKINAAVTNAQKFIEIQNEFGSFDKYVWQFVNEKPIVNKFKKTSEIPAVSKEAETLSKDLKSRGFKFVGPTIIYAFMQGAGLVNDHLVSCFRYKEVQK